MFRQLVIFVEGDDDEMFIEKIIQPCFEKRYDLIKIDQSAQEKAENIMGYLDSIMKMNNDYIESDYIYIVDIDSCPCITTKKDKIKQEIKNIDISKIIVVCKEIESWYYGGLTQDSLKALGIDKATKFKTTDTLTKEQFNQSIPNKFKYSRIDFMQEIIKGYNLSHVIQNNTNQSLGYFIHRYQINTQ